MVRALGKGSYVMKELLSGGDMVFWGVREKDLIIMEVVGMDN